MLSLISFLYCFVVLSTLPGNWHLQLTRTMLGLQQRLSLIVVLAMSQAVATPLYQLRNRPGPHASQKGRYVPVTKLLVELRQPPLWSWH